MTECAFYYHRCPYAYQLCPLEAKRSMLTGAPLNSCECAPRPAPPTHLWNPCAGRGRWSAPQRCDARTGLSLAEYMDAPDCRTL